MVDSMNTDPLSTPSDRLAVQYAAQARASYVSGLVSRLEHEADRSDLELAILLHAAAAELAQLAGVKS
jgi:hypothetical protein